MAKTFCWTCGARLPKGSSVCPRCSTQPDKSKPSVGTDVPARQAVHQRRAETGAPASARQNFCRRCGSVLSPGTQSCPVCRPAAGAHAAAAGAVPNQAFARQNFCRRCGSALSPGTQSCPRCQPAGASRAAAVGAAHGQSAAVRTQSGAVQQRSALGQVPSAAAAPADAAAVKKVPVWAAAAAGEFEGGEFSLGAVLRSGGRAAKSAAQKQISSALGTLFGGALSFVGGFFTLIVHPKVMFLTMCMAGLWTFLEMHRSSDSALIQFLSWLTFAGGGYNRDLLGCCGGMLGKGAVALALGSLFGGGIGSAFKGLKAFFSRGEEKGSFVKFAFGALTGAALYCVFAGWDEASADTAAAGIAGVVLSLQALGGRQGFLFSLAQSLSSRLVDGVRTARNGALNSWLKGMAVGFAAMTVYKLW